LTIYIKENYELFDFIIKKPWHYYGIYKNKFNKEREMQLLEIVELRTVEKHQKDLLVIFNELVKFLTKETIVKEIKIFRSLETKTDFSIHIYYSPIKKGNAGTELGERLIDYLKGYGLINHYQWIELKKNKLL